MSASHICVNVCAHRYDSPAHVKASFYFSPSGAVASGALTSQGGTALPRVHWFLGGAKDVAFSMQTDPSQRHSQSHLLIWLFRPRRQYSPTFSPGPGQRGVRPVAQSLRHWSCRCPVAPTPPGENHRVFVPELPAVSCPPDGPPGPPCGLRAALCLLLLGAREDRLLPP